MKDLVSFIIPTYNNEDTIEPCIQSILKQTCQKEIIAVDGNSTDKTKDIINKYHLKLITEKKRGAGAARNRGSKIARGNYIAFVDADAVLPENWSVKALRILKEANKDVAGVAGPVMSLGKNAIGMALDTLSFGKPKNIGRIYTNALNTTGVMFKIAPFRNTMFDENFIRGEDTELGFRMREKGYRLLFDGELYVYHHHPTTFKGLFDKWFTYGKSYPLSYLRHKKMIGIWFYSRIFYMPILCLLIGLSLLWEITIWIACIQLSSLFFAYVYTGLKIPLEIRKINILTFSIIHTIKQLAQLIGIWFGFFERLF
jgi:glycosyltransferase involved in cell wall biosynthesis